MPKKEHPVTFRSAEEVRKALFPRSGAEKAHVLSQDEARDFGHQLTEQVLKSARKRLRSR
jgi:hypothetical protein